ncbi:MAG: AMP-binding protein [Clostridia bacterium]|nr:AMP-binding protein [Clostridia bacterium]
MKTKDSLREAAQFPEMRTVKQIVLYGAEHGADKKQYMFENFDGDVQTKTFREVFHDVHGFGQMLYARGLRGKKIAILSENSYYWIAAYFAVITGKMTAIPLDPKLPAEDLTELMVRSGCNAIVYSKTYAPAIAMMREDENVRLTDYIPIEAFYALVQEGYDDLAKGTADYIDDEVLPDDLAFIVYTSGTTGKSKGVMLSQNNVASDAAAAVRVMTGGHAIGFLPLNHTFSWVGALFTGCLLTNWGYICTSIKDIQSDLKTYKPQNFSAVPLVVETIYDRIWKTARKGGMEETMQKGLRLSRFLMRHGIDMRRRIFRRIIDNLGGNLEMIVCGGAYLDEKYERGMYDFGIRIINGYGITECSPAVTCNRLDNFRFGSVGLPLPCCEIMIHDPDAEGVGEIYVRGDNVMLGYYDDPEATAEAFDGEWFKTGDFGYMDADGFLYYRGRKKNLIVLSNGKNVSPEELEDKLSALPYVKEVLVYEEGRRIAAEFFLDTENTPDAAERLRSDVDAVNRRMPSFKQIGRIKTRDTEFPKTTSLKIIRNYDKRDV